MLTLTSAILLGSLSGCDRNAKDLVPHPDENFPPVIEIGHLDVVPPDEFNAANGAPLGSLPYIKPDICEGENGSQRCYYGQLGQAETGDRGGATFTFTGTGEELCLIVDPETVFWAQSIAPGSLNTQFAFPDHYRDDGDIDLFAGLSSYYTGSPNVELGNFTGFYTDGLGNTVEIEYGECFQTGAQTGMDNGHAGRGTVEYCTIDTDLKEGVEYTAVLETFSVPLDDGVLSFGVAVVDERCARIDHSECMIRGEAIDKETGEVKTCTDVLEAAACDGKLGSFCCANPEMCGNGDQVIKDGVCEDIYEVGGAKVDRDTWCSSTRLCCEYSGASNMGGGGGGDGDGDFDFDTDGDGDDTGT